MIELVEFIHGAETRSEEEEIELFAIPPLLFGCCVLLLHLSQSLFPRLQLASLFILEPPGPRLLGSTVGVLGSVGQGIRITQMILLGRLLVVGLQLQHLLLLAPGAHASNHWFLHRLLFLLLFLILLLVLLHFLIRLMAAALLHLLVFSQLLGAAGRWVHELVLSLVPNFFASDK